MGPATRRGDINVRWICGWWNLINVGFVIQEFCSGLVQVYPPRGGVSLTFPPRVAGSASGWLAQVFFPLDELT